MKRMLGVFALLILAASCAQAQTGIYGAFSTSNYDVGNVGWQYGSTFGMYYDHWGGPFLRAGIDVRAVLLGAGNKKLDSGLIGPRLQLHVHPRVLPIMPYVEALGGGARVTLGQGSAYMDESGPEVQLVGGLEMILLPRLDWRVAEYSWGSVLNVGRTMRPSTLSTGLVLRVPWPR
jgi:hypothetical protein